MAIIEENQPQWLSFLNGEIDALVANSGSVPLEFAPLAVPNGALAPNLARRGVQLHRNLRADVALLYFNMDDPVVGGYAPARVALRRALNLAVDIPREITLARRGQAIPAQSPSVPHTTGYDPVYRSEMGEFDLSRARALLSNKDFTLLRAALASHARATDEPDELARISALYHRLGNFA